MMKLFPRHNQERILFVVLALVLAGEGIWLGRTIQAGFSRGRDADIHRQWSVSQYIRQGVNPYAVGLRILEKNFGPLSGPHRIRLTETKLYDVPWSAHYDERDGVLKKWGPPTCTYAPSAMCLLAQCLGPIPESWLLPVWSAINLVLLGCLIAVLAWARPFRHATWRMNVFWISCAVLAWPPTHAVFLDQQFSILVTLALILGLYALDKGREWTAGCFLCLASLKPSLALPFFFIPLVRKQWKSLLPSAVIHSMALLWISRQVSASPFDLMRDWLATTRYMLQGAFTIQEIINRLGWDNTPMGSSLTFGLLILALAFLWFRRNGSLVDQAIFAAMIALTWTYHETYDYVILTASFPVYAIRIQQPGRRMAALTALISCSALGLALFRPIYGGLYLTARLIRWAGRLSVLALGVMSVIQLWTGKPPQNTPRTAGSSTTD